MFETITDEMMVVIVFMLLISIWMAILCISYCILRRHEEEAVSNALANRDEVIRNDAADKLVTDL